MKKDFRVTVLIPCHSIKYLAKAILSIRDQTLNKNEFEVLLIADRININEARKILDETGITFRIIESLTPGIVPALNLGLENIESKFVARMDEDDIMMPGRLKTQLKFLEENEEMQAVGGQLILIDENDVTIGVSNYRKIVKLNPVGLPTHSPIAHPASMFRLQSVRNIGGYRDFSSEDWDLWVRLRELGPIGNLKIPVLKYRVHEKQLSRERIYSQNVAQQFISVSYFARKSNLRDHPINTEDKEKWLERTIKILRIVSSEYCQFEIRYNLIKELESILFLTSTKQQIRKFALLGLKDPLSLINFLLQKITLKVKKFTRKTVTSSEKSGNR